MRLATAACVAMVLLQLASPARAAEFEIFVDIDSEEDLFDLLEQGQISQETFDALIEVYRQGVDLDTASREELYQLPNLSYDEVDGILAYRRESGAVGDPANLVGGGVLSREKLLAIAPFLRVREDRTMAYATDGWVRVPMVVLPNAPDVPSVAVSARVVTFKHLTVGGAAVLTHFRLGEVVYDPLRDALTAEPFSARPHVPKLYVRWEDRTYGIIAGSYRIGFGQRLTFDNTSRVTPNGFVLDDDVVRGTTLTSACKESQGELDMSPCTGAAGDEYAAPDFRWREGLFGAAAGVHDLTAGPGKLQLYGWFSSAARPIYQYEIYNKDTCGNPENDDDPGCAAPDVYKTQDDPLAPTSRFSFSTLPDMFRESTAGANVSFFTGMRTHVGATAYLSTVDWLVEGMDLDFQEYSRYPRGGAFGAAGVDGNLRVNEADVFAEVTRTFDSNPDGAGGGWGAILRSTATFKRQEVEASLRWYGYDFVNPYARPIASPDETGGQRARDEAGGRLRYTAVIDRRFTIRAAWDFWVTPVGNPETPLDDNIAKSTLYARTDYLITRKVGVGVWAAFSDKGVSEDAAMMECFETAFDTSPTGETLPCTGQKWQLAGRVKWMPNKRLTLSGQYQHTLLDDTNYPGSKRQDVSTWVAAAWKATNQLRVRGRVRFFDQDFADNTKLERSVWTYFDLTYRYEKMWRARLRYDLYLYLDDRVSTTTREPNPEHWLWLEMEAKF